jgi:3D (Asp-Asp-Asp) domain-containing protein
MVRSRAVTGPIALHRPLLAAVFAAILLAATPAAEGAATPPRRSSGPGPAAASNRALLDLYALESKLTRARAQLADASAKADALAARQRRTHEQLRFAEATLLQAQTQLGDRVRDLYMAGDPDPLAVVLGASSLDEVVAGIDDLRRAASQNQTTIAQTRRARRSLSRLTEELDVRQARLEAVRAAAAASASALESTLAERRAYLSQLRAKERLAAAQVSALERRAQAVQTQAAQVTEQNPSSLSPPEAAAVVSAGGWSARTLTVSATGYSIRGSTATGAPTGPGVVAVDPGVIPLGTRMTIPGYGEGVAADTGGAVRGASIDLWFPTLAQARAWGRRTVTITLH